MLFQTHAKALLCVCRRCLIGRYIAREYLVNIDEDVALFTGIVRGYDQKTKLFEVLYEADGTTESYPVDEVNGYIDLFEH